MDAFPFHREKWNVSPRLTYIDRYHNESYKITMMVQSLSMEKLIKTWHINFHVPSYERQIWRAFITSWIWNTCCSLDTRLNYIAFIVGNKSRSKNRYGVRRRKGDPRKTSWILLAAYEHGFPFRYEKWRVRIAVPHDDLHKQMESERRRLTFRRSSGRPCLFIRRQRRLVRLNDRSIKWYQGCQPNIYEIPWLVECSKITVKRIYQTSPYPLTFALIHF